MRKEIIESIECKLLRHGQVVTGTNMIESIEDWVKNHDRFKRFDVKVIEDGILSELILVGWKPYQSNM